MSQPTTIEVPYKKEGHNKRRELLPLIKYLRSLDPSRERDKIIKILESLLPYPDRSKRLEVWSTAKEKLKLSKNKADKWAATVCKRDESTVKKWRRKQKNKPSD